jgi:hypothetical protein
MPLINDGSILMSIKKLLNVEHDDQAFDLDIGMNINGVFMTLHQLGIGPDEGFHIDDADTKWSDFSTDKTLIDAVKMYVYLKTRLIFDPPASSIVSDAINQRIAELEFRLDAQAERDYGKSEPEPEPEPEPGPDPGPSPEPKPDDYEIDEDEEDLIFHGSLLDLIRGSAEPG